MTRKLLAGLAALGLLACGKGKQTAAMADSTARNLELAPGGNSGGGNSDRAANTVPRTRGLASGATINATMGETISSRSAVSGEKISTTVAADVSNSAGRVVIPAGSTIELTITDISPAKNKGQADGTLTFAVTNVRIRGKDYPISAQVTSLAHSLKGRGVGAGEVEKVAVGTAIGAVAGRIIGGNTKGAVVGGVVGAGGGTAVAIETASRDVVVDAGTPLTITLTGPLTVSVN